MAHKKIKNKIEKVGPEAMPIALVFDFTPGDIDVLRGIGRYAQECCNWTLVSVFPHRRLGEALASIKPAGIIVNAFRKGIEGILRKTGRPVVSMSPALAGPHFPLVALDEASAGVLAANHLIECGLKNFGYFGPPWGGPTSDREGGFYQTLQRLSYTPEVCYVRPPGANPRGGTFLSHKNICRWVRNLPKPAGVFAPNDVWASWLCGICRQEGVKVPDDIAIIGAENDESLCELAQPTISSTVFPADRLGYEAAVLLDRLIKRESVSNKPHLLPAVGVMARQSTNILAGVESIVLTAVRFIREHISEPITVEDVVRLSHLSRRSFDRKFRAALGRSPAHEIRRMRIAKAKTLLSGNTRMKIWTIARRCGFSSKAQFYASFHQATGMTPMDFRRTMGQENSQASFPASSPVSAAGQSSARSK